jgi:hypothetical protein
VENKKSILLSRLAVLFVLIIYLWFISLGPWRSRGHTSDYYSRLTSAFLHGQLSLEQTPDPALLALPNPYDHKARKKVPVLGDASLYKGKYYLYFGAFPSLALAIPASILPLKPGDQVFVYLFVAALFLLQCLLFRAIVKQFFPGMPGWILPFGILILGLTGPYTRMLTHPFIHEAAIAGGQLLFIAGVYTSFLALRTEKIHKGILALAGLFWLFAVATRSTQLVPVGFMTALTFLYIFHRCRRTNLIREFGWLAAALIAPLAVGGMILGWYNWARFDSVLEFGLYYELAAFNLQANYPILFSKVYFIQNIYNYFLNPFGVSASFPYLSPLTGHEKPVLTFFELPNLYAVEGKFPGALLSTPFLFFAIIPAVMFCIKIAGHFRNRDRTNDLFNLFDWTALGLLGSFIAGCIPILLYYYVGFRFEADFVASLTLLALIGFCQGYFLIKNDVRRKMYAIIGILLSLFSVLINMALSYSGIWA